MTHPPNLDQVVSSRAVPQGAESALELLPEAFWSEWDKFLSSVPGADLVQSSLWAKTKQSMGFGTEVIVLRPQNRGKINAGALLLHRRILPGIRVGCVAHGPVLSPSVGLESVAQFIQGLGLVARQRGLTALIVQPMDQSELLTTALAQAGYAPGGTSVSPTATICLSLRRTETELLAGMHSMRRRNIRKALASRLKVWRGGDESVRLFSQLHHMSAQRQGFIPVSERYLQAQWEILRPAGCLEAFFVREGETVHAGIWLSCYRGVVTYRLAGWNSQVPSNSRPNEAVHWEAIRWAKSQGFEWYDLGGFDRRAALAISRGEPVPDGALASHNQFKRAFGGEIRLLPMPMYKLKYRRMRWIATLGEEGFLRRWAKRWASRLRS